jgi:hypothetical protein
MLPYNPRASQEDEDSVRVLYGPPHPTVLVRNDNGPSVTFSSPYLRYLSCLAIHGLKVTDPMLATPWLSDGPARVNPTITRSDFILVPNFWELLLLEEVRRWGCILFLELFKAHEYRTDDCSKSLA